MVADDGVRIIHVDDLKALAREAAKEGVRDFLEEIGVKREDAHLLRSAVEWQKTMDRAKGEIGREISKTLARALIWVFAAGLIALAAKSLGLAPTWLIAATHKD
jgi:hypothetical protein